MTQGLTLNPLTPQKSQPPVAVTCTICDAFLFRATRAEGKPLQKVPK